MSTALPAVEVVREPGGEVLVAYPRRDVPLVGVELRLPGGRSAEPAGLPGLAQLAADLLAEGPAGTAPTEWKRTTENLAAEIDCSARIDHWSLRFDCLGENLDEAGGLLSRLLASPGLPGSEWRRLVKSRRAGARESWAQPMTVIRNLALVQSLGYAHPAAHPPFEKSFARAGHADGAALAALSLRRGRGVFAAIGGDFDPGAGFDILRRLLGALGSGGPGEPTEPEPAPGAAVWLADDPKVDQVFFALTRRGIRSGDPDRVALRLANYLIGGGGFESRLMDRVREEAGGTYGISSQLPERTVASPFAIQSFTVVERFAEMLEIIERTLEEIASDGFTAEELSRAVGNRFGALPLQLSSPRAVLDHALGGLRAGLEPEQLERDWRAFRETPLEAVNAAAQRLIGDGAFRLAALGPRAKILPQIGDRGRVEIFAAKSPPDRWPAADRLAGSP